MFRKTALLTVVALGTLAGSSAVSAHEDQSSVSAIRDTASHPAPHGFKGVLPTADGMSGAALTFLAVEGQDIVRVACIEAGVDFLDGVEYHADGSDALRAISSDDLAAVRWLAGHMTFNADGSLGSSPVGTPMLAGEYGITAEMLPLAEGAAAQLAIWKHTQGVDISGVPNPGIVARANDLADLLADSANRNFNEGAHDFSVDTSANVDVDGVGSIEVALLGQYALELLPVSGVEVTVSAPGVDLDALADGVQDSVVLSSDENGIVSLADLSGMTGETEVTATATFALLPGTVLSTEGGQQVATLNVASVSRADSALPTVEVAPSTTVPETTVPETTVPETTVPETTVPETTVPETTVPETTVPETTTPETTVVEVPEEEGLPNTGNELTYVLLGLGLAAGIFGLRMRSGSVS